MDDKLDTRQSEDQPEIWVPCPCFLRYEISSHGRFRNARTNRIVKKHINKRTGYYFVHLYSTDSTVKTHKSVRAAPLIALAFLGPKPADLTQIDHLFGKQREAAGDLEYCTQEVNIQRSYMRGGRKIGKPNPLTQADHDRIKQLWATGEYSQVEIGRIVGLTNSGVSRILSGRSRGPRPARTGPRVRTKPRSTVLKDRVAGKLAAARKHISEHGPLSSYKLAKLMGVVQATALRYLWMLEEESKTRSSDDSANCEVVVQAADVLSSPNQGTGVQESLLGQASGGLDQAGECPNDPPSVMLSSRGELSV